MGWVFDPTKMYDVSASAQEVRLTFPVATDVDPATAALGMSPDSSPGGNCSITGTGALRMEGWTLVLDPAAMAASRTGACVAANPGSGYRVWIDAEDARDHLCLSISVRLDPASTIVDVALKPIWPNSVEKSFVTAPTPATPGGTVRLSGVGGTFESSDPFPRASLLNADGSVVSYLDGQLSMPFSTWVDGRRPLPVAAAEPGAGDEPPRRAGHGGTVR